MRARATSPFRGAKRNEGGAHGAQRNARGMPAEAGTRRIPTTPTRKPKPQTTNTESQESSPNPNNPRSDNTPRRAPVDYLPPQHANQRPKTQTTQPIFFADIRAETLIAGFQSSCKDRLMGYATLDAQLRLNYAPCPPTCQPRPNAQQLPASSHARCVTIEDLMSFTAKSLADCHNLLSPSIDLDLPLRSRLAISSQSPHSRGT